MARWVEAGCVAFGVLVTGCTSPQPVNTPGDAVTGMASATSAASIDRLHLEGLVELHWTDEDGTHREQGDLEVWMDGHDRVSMRVTKFGDVYLWMGVTPDTGFFLFDLTSEDSVLVTGTPTDGPVWMRTPDLLRRMLGMAPVPETATVEAIDNAVTITCPLETGGEDVLTLDQTGRHLTALQLSLDDGTPVQVHHRDHGNGVDLGVMQLARFVDVHVEGDLVRLRFAHGTADGELPPAVFDLERLTQAMRPDRVERLRN